MIIMVTSTASGALENRSNEVSLNTTMIAVVVSCIGACIIIVVFLYVYYAHRRSNQLKQATVTNQSRTAPVQEFENPIYTVGSNNSVNVFRELPRDHLRIGKLLGKGYYGEVHKALLNGALSMAVKSLKNVSDEAAELLKEAEAMAGFRHPNVAEFIGAVKGSPFLLVLRYYEYGSLENLLKKKEKFTTTDAKILLARNIARGMEAIALHGFVHRDLASRNVLIDAELQPKVSDFGLSRKKTTDSDSKPAYYYVPSHDAKLPIRWSSPEGYFEQKFSEKSDVWSFGMLLFEIFAEGEVPYQNLNNQQVIGKLANHELPPQPFLVFYPDLIYGFQNLCWQKDAHLRPTFSQTVKHFGNLYEEYMATITSVIVDNSEASSISGSSNMPGLDPPVDRRHVPGVPFKLV